jgi:nucleoside-diphosphate-sugar epimerase
MMRKTIWITGSHGFVGNHLVSELIPFYNVKRISNSTNLEFSYQDDTISFDFKNKLDIQKIIETIGVPDIFIHLGWGSMDDPHSTLHLTTNVLQSQNLIDILYSSGLEKFIFLGSMNEYGEHVGSLSENLTPKGYLTNYAKGKINVANYGFKSSKLHNKIFIHIRLFYTIGRIERGGSLIRELYNSSKNNIALSLGPCEHFRDYISIVDTVKGIRLLCDVSESITVNLGSGKSTKMKDFVNLFWNKLGGSSEMLQFGTKSVSKEQPQQNCYANLDRLKTLTGGWKPTQSIEEGISFTINELQNLTDNFKNDEK